MSSLILKIVNYKRCLNTVLQLCLVRRRVTTIIPSFANLCYPDEHIICHKLHNRGLIKATGKDTSNFLQGLITNDMTCLDTKCDITALYTLLLNVQGRVLYDLIIYKLSTDSYPEYLLECDKEAIPEVVAIMKKYRIRKKVDFIDMQQDLQTWGLCPNIMGEKSQILPVQVKESEQTNVVTYAVDPRIKTFGWRIILPAGYEANKAVENGKLAENESSYTERRYMYGLCEGILDMPPGSSLPLESNAEFLNGVSFLKGCYIGQELTARTHHTGVIRKRLMPVHLSSDNHSCQPGDTVVNSKGKNCGKFRFAVGHYGLALLRVGDVIGSELAVKNSAGDMVDHMNTWIPQWWPKDTDEVIKKALAQVQVQSGAQIEEEK